MQRRHKFGAVFDVTVAGEEETYENKQHESKHVVHRTAGGSHCRAIEHPLRNADDGETFSSQDRRIVRRILGEFEKSAALPGAAAARYPTAAGQAGILRAFIPR